MIRLDGFRGPAWLLADVVVFGTLIGAVYVLLLPAFFSGSGTSLVLIIGMIVASLIGGYIGFQNAEGDQLAAKAGLSVAFAVLAAILVVFLSLFIILNTRGG